MSLLPVPWSGKDVASVDALMNLRTGELVPLDATPAEIADALDALKDLEENIKIAKAAGSRALVALMDRQARWTLHAGAFKVTAPSPDPVEEFDAEGLFHALVELEAEGVIGEEALDAAVEVSTCYKARKAGINALRKLGPEVREVVDRFSSSVEKANRTAKVSRA